jgi:hypothetical protein
VGTESNLYEIISDCTLSADVAELEDFHFGNVEPFRLVTLKWILGYEVAQSLDYQSDFLNFSVS